MTSPPEQIKVECPQCRSPYTTIHRASMNLTLDDFDQAYVEEMSTGTCPACRYVVKLGALVVDSDGTLRMMEPG